MVRRMLSEPLRMYALNSQRFSPSCNYDRCLIIIIELETRSSYNLFNRLKELDY